MRYPFAIASLLFISIICNSCKDDYNICGEPKEVKFIAGFYQRIGNSDVPIQAPNLTIRLSSTSIPVYNNQINVSSFGFPLILNGDTSKYIINLGNNYPQDTLTIIYTTQGANTLPECGVLFFHTITKLTSTTNSIDSVFITNPSLNTSLAQNAKIYF
jgi:Family of unknown function (DUF6452)